MASKIEASALCKCGTLVKFSGENCMIDMMRSVFVCDSCGRSISGRRMENSDNLPKAVQELQADKPSETPASVPPSLKAEAVVNKPGKSKKHFEKKKEEPGGVIPEVYSPAFSGPGAIVEHLARIPRIKDIA